MITDVSYNQLATAIINSNRAHDFVETVLSMLHDPRCDLDGRVAHYANKLTDIADAVEEELADEILQALKDAAWKKDPQAVMELNEVYAGTDMPFREYVSHLEIIASEEEEE